MQTQQIGRFDAGLVATCALVALGLGLLTRLPYFVGLEFPLNDGGLFIAMIEAIQNAGFALPETVDYNARAIPMAYPPLSFYVAAALSSIMSVEPLSVMLYMPLAINLACLPLFVILAAQLVERRSTLFFAAFALPLIPRSYEWMIMGGGLSRSPGFLLALIGLLCTVRATRTLDRKWIIATTVVLGMTLATHLEWGVTGWTSAALYILAHRRDRAAWLTLLVIGLGMGVVSSPWWVTVVARHGIDPFLAASMTSGWDDAGFFDRIRSFDLFTLRSSWLALFALIGFGFSLHRRQFFVPLWLLLIFLATPRHAATPASMPVAILVGVALTEIADRVTALVRSRWKARTETGNAALALSSDAGDPSGWLMHAVMIVIFFGCIAHDTNQLREWSPLIALNSEELEGMRWIRDNSDPDDRFLVVSLARAWEADRTAEWFPIVAQRQSVNAPQGLEWIKDAHFVENALRGDIHRQVVAVTPSSAPVLGQRVFGSEHTHAAVFAKTGHPIHLSYVQSPYYHQIHSAPGVTIYRQARASEKVSAR